MEIEIEPAFSKNDKQLFYKYLNKATYYFEYGTGGSTYQASIRKNIKQIITVESDYIWHTQFKFLLESDEIQFIYCYLDCKTNTWGNPGPKSTITDWIEYSDQMKKVDEKILAKIDFILIDERFRVACCLKCFDLIQDDCLIAFDDFLNRPGYHIVLDYYDIVDKSKDNIMAILKKKKTITNGPSKELIEEYEKLKA
jgi:hypothetical protein